MIWSLVDLINPLYSAYIGTPGQTYFSDTFDKAYWDSYSFIYNSLDIFIVIPIHIFLLLVLKLLSCSRFFPFRAAYYRAYNVLWHALFLSLFLKVLMGLFINYFIFMPLGTEIDKTDVFVIVFFGLTLIIFCLWYLWACWYALKQNYKGLKHAFLVTTPGRFNDDIDYYPEDMAQNWITTKIFLDINVKKPLAAFTHIVFFSKRIIFVAILCTYKDLGFTCLLLYTCLNLLSLVWMVLV